MTQDAKNIIVPEHNQNQDDRIYTKVINLASQARKSGVGFGGDDDSKMYCLQDPTISQNKPGFRIENIGNMTQSMTVTNPDGSTSSILPSAEWKMSRTTLVYYDNVEGKNDTTQTMIIDFRQQSNIVSAEPRLSISITRSIWEKYMNEIPFPNGSVPSSDGTEYITKHAQLSEADPSIKIFLDKVVDEFTQHFK